MAAKPALTIPLSPRNIAGPVVTAGWRPLLNSRQTRRRHAAVSPFHRSPSEPRVPPTPGFPLGPWRRGKAGGRRKRVWRNVWGPRYRKWVSWRSSRSVNRGRSFALASGEVSGRRVYEVIDVNVWGQGLSCLTLYFKCSRMMISLSRSGGPFYPRRSIVRGGGLPGGRADGYTGTSAVLSRCGHSGCGGLRVAGPGYQKTG